MSNTGPILLIDDDEDDYELFTHVMLEQKIPNALHHFTDGKRALEYLQSTPERPFLILSDINMPKLGGIELRKIVSEDDKLRSKCIPFIFFTTTATEQAVKKAYDLSVQGFFVKGETMERLSSLIKLIVDYWTECKHPNSYLNSQ